MIKVKNVKSGTLAERAGFEPGDRILSINGERVDDLIDFQVHSSDEQLDYEVERCDEIYEVSVRRGADEVMGFDFEEMRLRQCNNKCVFCFLHQMPKGLRRSLYFEDDDFRLSFLHGSYVTLTNVRDADLQRIIDHRLSPQYISVHATEPQLRQQLLGRRAVTVPILDRIRLLADHGIEMHAQVVVCPGHNDGIHLERTVADLAEQYPAVRSVAIVPVGLTRFRQHLPQLQPVTVELAREYLYAIEEWGDSLVSSKGERFVYGADELFLLCDRQPPPVTYYDAFPQIENGIGMVRTFLDLWERRRREVVEAVGSTPMRIALLTGALASRFLTPIGSTIGTAGELHVDVVVVDNEFFGTGITVSGLLTGRDMINALAGREFDLALLPPNCVNGDGVTLDDFTVAQLQEASGTPLRIGSYDLAGSILEGVTGAEPRLQGSARQLEELGFYVGRKE